jgi:stringent starvation protein B
MLSTKPYLLRAIHEWCLDQGFTPYLNVVVDHRTKVPLQFVRNGEIVLNLNPEAVNQLQLGNEMVTFQARFGGVVHAVSVPVDNVAAIYARENGHGMQFPVATAEQVGAPETENPPPEPPPAPSGRPKLTIVK